MRVLVFSSQTSSVARANVRTDKAPTRSLKILFIFNTFNNYNFIIQTTIGGTLLLIIFSSFIYYAAAYYWAMVSGGNKKKKLSELIDTIDLELNGTASSLR